MKKIKSFGSTLCAVVILAGCSFSNAVKLSEGPSYVPVDANKYATAQALETALLNAKRTCEAQVQSYKRESTGIDIQDAAFESSAATSKVGFASCMAGLGFVERSN